MRRLTLLRHAKSGEDTTAARDFDRRLNAKGRRAARAIGRYLRDEGLGFDAVFASPAVRVAETLDEVGAGYGAALPIRWERRIYLASVAELMDLVHEAPDEAPRLLIAGHNPGLEQLALTLAGEGAPLRRLVEEKYPTASLAEIALPIDTWRAAARASGRIERFVRPRDLDATLGPDDG